MYNLIIHYHCFERWLIPMSLIFVLLWPFAGARAEEHNRDGWFIGMGYGYCIGAIKASTALEYSYQDGATPQIRFGHSVGNHLMVGLEYGGWMFEEGDINDKYRYSLQSINAAVTWHPGSADAYWGGFYTRAGAGLACGRTVWVIIEEQEQVGFQSLDETGLGFIFQIGYEFRITRNAAAGMSTGFSTLNIGKELFDEAQFSPLAMTLNWYWD
jgi:hypothetical protein